MAIIKTANIISLTSELCSSIQSEIRAKLFKYSSARVVQLGLAAKSFPYEFDFSFSQNSSQKSVGRLKTLLSKHILKVNPYTAFAKNEMIQVRDRHSLSIELDLSEAMYGFDGRIADWRDFGFPSKTFSPFEILSNAALMHHYGLEDPDTKWMSRYAQYLNYMFRRHSVPVQIVPEISIIPDKNEMYAARNMDASDRSSARISYRIYKRFRFDLGTWITTSTVADNAYRDMVTRGSGDGITPDLWRGEHWSFHQWYSASQGSFEGARANVMFHKYSTEKIFMHLDKGLCILNTLTRKVSYGSSAFSFRNS